MLSYCLKCRKITKSKNPKICKSEQRKNNALSKFELRDSRKSILKKQEGSGLLSSLANKDTLSKFSLAGLLFF